MEFKPKKIIEDLLKIKRIKDVVAKEGLNDKQLLDALPILIDMSEQKDTKDIKFLTSLTIDDGGNVIRIEVPSSHQKSRQYQNMLLTSKIEKIDFEDDKEFIKELSRKEIVSSIKKYMHKDKEEKLKGLYIYGDMGVGKTFMLKRIAKKLAENGSTIGFITLPSFVGYIKTKFGNASSYTEVVNTLKEVDFLFIDDIGAEQISSWFRDEILLAVLNERMSRNRKTFFSSNYSMKQLEKIESQTSGSKYRDNDRAIRLMNRIKTLSKEIKLEGKNKR